MLIALFGTLLGLAVGVFFGWSAVQAQADSTVTILRIPLAPLAVVSLVAVLAGVAAAAQPARRAARLDVLSALMTT
jgi:putative ABC transport system permease protein